MSLSKEQITEIAATISVDFASLAAFMEVESSGKGFSPVTGKIIIQFEPHIFAKSLEAAKINYTMTVALENGRKKYTIVSGAKTIVNSVEGQTAEWVAFDTATAIYARGAKMSTSIGLGQVMGFNHGKLGFKTVEEMWTEFEKGDYQQVVGMTFFIKNTPGLLDALKAKNWAKVARLYNGGGYAVNKYDIKLGTAYAKYKKIQDAPATSTPQVTPARSFSPGRASGSLPKSEKLEIENSEDEVVIVESVLSAHSFFMDGLTEENARPRPKPSAKLRSSAKPKNTDKTKPFSKGKNQSKTNPASKKGLATPAPKPVTSKKAVAPKKPIK